MNSYEFLVKTVMADMALIEEMITIHVQVSKLRYKRVIVKDASVDEKTTNKTW